MLIKSCRHVYYAQHDENQHDHHHNGCHGNHRHEHKECCHGEGRHS
ncbi:PadR family transcriptional regulator, partial [Providencia rettgeri]|nr:PadR family transcriptional regulator [Providencia rettgeri]